MKRSALFLFLWLSLVLMLSSCKENRPLKQVIMANWESVFSTDQIRVLQNTDSVRITSSHQDMVILKKKLPVKRIYTTTSAPVAFLETLDKLPYLSGVVSEAKYIYAPMVHEMLRQGKVKSFGGEGELNIETILEDRPDVVISSPNPLLAKFHKQIENNGIRLIILEEYAEQHPLLQAEYIKLFGLLTGAEEKSNEIYAKVEKNYKELKNRIKEEKEERRIIAGVMYGDVWYAPGKKSLAQAFFSDVGAENVLLPFGSRIGFETVLNESSDVDFWLNAADFSSISELKGAYKNYNLLPVVQAGNVFNWSARRSANGANDYFEKGIVRPDLVLQDVATILYPNRFPKSKLIFYRKLD